MNDEKQRLNSKAVWLFFLNSAFIFMAIVLLIGFNLLISVAVYKIELAKFLSIVFLAILLLAFIWAKLKYHFYFFELREDGFRKESGVILKKYVTIPYNRIQNIDIYRGVLARILGLSNIHIQTAGMSSSIGQGGAGRIAEGQLPGLSKEYAEKLRDELIRRTNKSKDQGL